MKPLLHSIQFRLGYTLLSVLILPFLFSSCIREDGFMRKNGVSGKISLDFSLGASDEGSLDVSDLRATSGAFNLTDPNDECYVRSLWMIVFKSDGTLLRSPQNILSKLDGMIYRFDETLNYGEYYTCYFVANPEDAGIDLSGITTEVGLKNVSWTIPASLDVKDVYSKNTLPKIRLMNAKYEIGVKPYSAGGGIYSQRIHPATNVREPESYHVDEPGKGAKVPVLMHRCYSKVTVNMYRNQAMHDKFVQEYGDQLNAELKFSLTGFSKSFKLFDSTPVPASAADKHADITYDFDIVHPEQPWVNEHQTMTLYFPAGQIPSHKSIEQSIPRPYGLPPVKVTTKYADPCVRISYRHFGVDHFVFVNSKDGMLFEQNYDYRLPLEFFTQERNVWLVRLANVKKETPESELKFNTLNTTDPVTFANSLRCEEPKNYFTTGLDNLPDHFYGKGVISYGNLYAYNTIIETMSLGGPAKIENLSELKDWMKDIREVDCQAFNTNDKLIYRQLWLLNPKDNTPLTDEVLRGNIVFRNKFDFTSDPATSMTIRCHFNVLNKIAALNLGQLNKFANGKETEFDPLMYHKTYTDTDEANPGDMYEFGRNLPLGQSDLTSRPKVPVNLHSATTTTAQSEIQKIWGAPKVFLAPLNQPSTNNAWFFYNSAFPNVQGIEDLKGDDKVRANASPWAWVVNKTKELYGAPDTYVGNNGGDPCPPKYYKMPTSADFQYIIYNQVLSDGKKNIPMIDANNMGKEIGADGMSPGGNPTSSDLSVSFKATYQQNKAKNKIYALRFTGTKWASIFIYERVQRGSRWGIQITSYPAKSISYDRIQFLADVASDKVETGLDKDEMQVRFFPFSRIMYTNSGSVHTHADISYTSYLTNTMTWSGKEFRVLDIDMQLTPEQSLIMAHPATATAIRCLRK